VMGNDLESTLAALFKGPAQQVPVVAKTAAKPRVEVASSAAPPAVSTGAPANMSAAATHYHRAIAALREGDWAQFGSEMQKLGEELKQ
jgi:uncharacterized membrane protein (UPF0182 family)